MARGDAIIRGEAWTLAFGKEASYGTDPGTSAIVGCFGVVQNATVPDAPIELTPTYALGQNSKRDFYTVYRGRVQLTGAVSDIWLLNGAPLYLAIGKEAVVGTSGGTGASTLATVLAKGSVTATLASHTGYASGDVIQIGSGAVAEVRSCVPSGTSGLLTLNYPTQFAHVSGDVCHEVVSPYTHSISESNTLESFTLQHEMFDADGNNELVRRFSGGKVGRMTLSASEGEQLKCSLSDMSFSAIATSGVVITSGVTVSTTSVNYPTTEQYLFSYGKLTFWGTEFARIRNFSLDVNNALDPKYYLTVQSGASFRLPYEIREGKREYRLSATLDISDATLFNELRKYGVNQGDQADNTFKGFDVSIVFTRGTSDSITITAPPVSVSGTFTAVGNTQGCFIRSAPHNISTENTVAVPVDILVRSLKIDIVDSIGNYMTLT